MNEIKIDLSGVSVQEFLAINANIIKIGTYFPKIKIVARVILLKHMVRKIFKNFLKKRKYLLHITAVQYLNDEIPERIIFANNKEKTVLNGGTEVNILHGVGGKIIEAKTLNQKRLVESMNKNDMVFAIGPAGTGKTYLELLW